MVTTLSGEARDKAVLILFSSPRDFNFQKKASLPPVWLISERDAKMSVLAHVRRTEEQDEEEEDGNTREKRGVLLHR